MGIREFFGLEKRASYTDLLTEILVSRAAATNIVSAYSAAIETAKGTVAQGLCCGGSYRGWWTAYTVRPKHDRE